MATKNEWKRFMSQLSEHVKNEFGCNILQTTVTSVEDATKIPGGMMHIPLLCQENRVSLEDMKGDYVACLAMEIDDNDYIVSSNPSVSMLDWDFEALLEQLCKTEVLSIGAIRSGERRYRTFKWFVSGD